MTAESGYNDLFGAIIALKYLLPEDDFVWKIDNLQEEIDRFLESSHILSEEDVIKHLNFPENWLEIKDMSKGKD